MTENERHLPDIERLRHINRDFRGLEYKWIKFKDFDDIRRWFEAIKESANFNHDDYRRQLYMALSRLPASVLDNRIKTAARRSLQNVPENAPEPPKWAECLLVVCSGKRAEAIQGDLSERFTRDCARTTVQRARWLYRARVLKSLLPLVKRTIGRAVKWTAIISAAKRFIIG